MRAHYSLSAVAFALTLLAAIQAPARVQAGVLAVPVGNLGLDALLAHALGSSSGTSPGFEFELSLPDMRRSAPHMGILPPPQLQTSLAAAASCSYSAPTAFDVFGHHRAEQEQAWRSQHVQRMPRHVAQDPELPHKQPNQHFRRAAALDHDAHGLHHELSELLSDGYFVMRKALPDQGMFAADPDTRHDASLAGQRPLCSADGRTGEAETPQRSLAQKLEEQQLLEQQHRAVRQRQLYEKQQQRRRHQQQRHLEEERQHAQEQEQEQRLEQRRHLQWRRQQQEQQQTQLLQQQLQQQQQQWQQQRRQRQQWQQQQRQRQQQQHQQRQYRRRQRAATAQGMPGAPTAGRRTSPVSHSDSPLRRQAARAAQVTQGARAQASQAPSAASAGTSTSGSASYDPQLQPASSGAEEPVHAKPLSGPAVGAGREELGDELDELSVSLGEAGDEERHTATIGEAASWSESDVW